MNLKSLLIATLLSTAALTVFAPPANAQPQAWACTDIPYDDTCPSTLCASLTSPTGFCTTRNICVVGETRCIGHLACVELSLRPVCVPDPCYTTACFASSPESPSVGGCNDMTSECDGNLVCVWISQQTPQCVRDPCPDLDCVAPPPCACAPFNAGPSVPQLLDVCVEGQTDAGCYDDHDVCVQFSYQVPFCADVPGITYSPHACLRGVRDCPSGDWACVGSLCMMQPCQMCAPLQANPSCLLFVEENTQFAGVTYHDCYYVDGYVCTNPVWYGGHGIWGWVCEASTPFSLP